MGRRNNLRRQIDDRRLQLRINSSDRRINNRRTVNRRNSMRMLKNINIAIETINPETKSHEQFNGILKNISENGVSLVLEKKIEDIMINNMKINIPNVSKKSANVELVWKDKNNSYIKCGGKLSDNETDYKYLLKSYLWLDSNYIKLNIADKIGRRKIYHEKQELINNFFLNTLRKYIYKIQYT
ncbi:MAG: hypothetical protein GF384_03950, partial [Elusimicrobia bacterium]|nr:hypothetical protein [Elusimicrobiota bacterium]